jgi:hypothetical protein
VSDAAVPVDRRPELFVTHRSPLLTADQLSKLEMLGGDWIREQAKELCLRHGFDPDQVWSIGYQVIDMPMLVFGCYLTGEDGRKAPRRGTVLMPRAASDVALRGALPVWWVPDGQRG